MKEYYGYAPSRKPATPLSEVEALESSLGEMWKSRKLQNRANKATQWLKRVNNKKPLLRAKVVNSILISRDKDMTEDLEDIEQLKQACHYSNLQPLWAQENLIKGKKLLYV